MRVYSTRPTVITFLTCDSDPTVETGALAVSMVTVRPVFTLTGLRAVRSVLVGLAVWTHTQTPSIIIMNGPLYT